MNSIREDIVEAGAKATYLPGHWVAQSFNLGQYKTRYVCKCGAEWVNDGHLEREQPHLNEHLLDVALTAMLPLIKDAWIEEVRSQYVTIDGQTAEDDGFDRGMERAARLIEGWSLDD